MWLYTMYSEDLNFNSKLHNWIQFVTTCCIRYKYVTFIKSTIQTRAASIVGQVWGDPNAYIAVFEIMKGYPNSLKIFGISSSGFLPILYLGVNMLYRNYNKENLLSYNFQALSIDKYIRLLDIRSQDLTMAKGMPSCK